ncbi:MFS transporter [Streptomyces indicus]|uniref:Major Facilitator Superfamily protein n=1 Tax=Streptomyces indicus TaxID=417292 RepID=A0A1G8Z3E9_9ACTN|nr:MFS transporter [Streptomyces indicus]SDK09669.1 Major Facilitator Superfamily protein [Streptomyces indicus]
MRGKGNGAGLIGQLRRPPGGRDARLMLSAQFVDRTGTGVWAASCVLYFTVVTGLDAARIGLLLGIAGVAGIAGSPVAGRLAMSFPVRTLLIACHVLRIGSVGLLLVLDSFAALLPVVALTSAGDRAAKTLEMVFATEVAGERRGTYQALFRTVANAGYALGAGIAALGLVFGAYRTLILANVLSFLVAALLVRCTRLRTPAGVVKSGAGQESSRRRRRGPWRDRGYLRFVLLDVPLNLDDTILMVGLPLWLVSSTDAPHLLVPVFLVVNTVMVVLLQLPFSARFDGPQGAVRALRSYGVAVAAGCGLLALSAVTSAAWAAVLLVLTAVVVTVAELLRSVSSWELAVSLAPERERAAYLGVAGMAQSVQKSAGPPLVTGAVMAAGPAGWLALGGVLAGLSVVQRAASARRLAVMEARTGTAEGRPRAEELPTAAGRTADPAARPAGTVTAEPADKAAVGPAAAPAMAADDRLSPPAAP